jgi:hypothetical protein
LCWLAAATVHAKTAAPPAIEPQKTESHPIQRFQSRLEAEQMPAP